MRQALDSADLLTCIILGCLGLAALAVWRSWFYLRQVFRFCSGQKLAKKYNAIPEYWENSGKSLNDAFDRSSPDFFDDIYPVPLQNRELLQQFINETSYNEEIHFQLVRAVRVEHSRLWSHWHKKWLGRERKAVSSKDAEPQAPTKPCWVLRTGVAGTVVSSTNWMNTFVKHTCSTVQSHTRHWRL